MSADQPGWRRLIPPSRRRILADIDLEIEFHLSARVAELESWGWSPEAARREALRRFGDAHATRAALAATDLRRERSRRRREWLSEAWQDAALGWRLLRGRPAFTGAAVATLAIGIGAATAIFSAADHVLLRRLPYAAPERAVTLWELDRTQDDREREVSPGNFLDWSEQATGFAALGLAEPSGFDFSGEGPPEALPAWLITEEFLPALGVTPALGRGLEAGEYQPGGPAAVMLAHGFWLRKFGGDSSVVGRAIRLDGRAVTVCGVLPPWLEYPEPADIWAPKVFAPGERQDRRSAYMAVVGRLRPGVSIGQAQAELDAIARRSAAAHPATNQTLGVRLVPLEVAIRGALRTPMLVLLAAVGLLVVIACANVATLLLARGAEREAEFGLRAALGAGRGRLVRQLLVESLLLGGMGGAAGVAVGWAGIHLLGRLAPAELARVASIGLDGRVLGFALGVTLCATLAAGLMPAVRLSRRDVQAALAGAGRALARSDVRSPTRSALIGAELALAVILLVAAGLLGRSFLALINNDLGFLADRRVALQIFLWDRNPSPDQRRARVEELTAGFRQVPGVRAVAVVSALPFHPHQITAQSALAVEGRPAPTDGEWPRVYTTVASPEYFRVMGIPLRGGRPFSPLDRSGAPAVALINETAARRAFPGEDPIGRRVTFGVMGPPLGREIVGVVSDVRPAGYDSDPRPEVFVPYAQSLTGSVTFVVHAAGDARPLAARLAAVVWQVDPEQAVYHTASLPSLVSVTLAPRRFSLTLIAGFAAIGVTLAAIGVHGLIRVLAVQRRREIGIRLALGAGPRNVAGLMAGQAAVAALGGVTAGGLGAVMLTPLLRSMLYAVQPLDPVTFGATIAATLALAGIAAYLPARRAATVDPARVLRGDG